MAPQEIMQGGKKSMKRRARLNDRLQPLFVQFPAHCWVAFVLFPSHR
jgi:hypothetical protein